LFNPSLDEMVIPPQTCIVANAGVFKFFNQKDLINQLKNLVIVENIFGNKDSKSSKNWLLVSNKDPIVRKIFSKS